MQRIGSSLFTSRASAVRHSFVLAPVTLSTIVRRTSPTYILLVAMRGPYTGDGVDQWERVKAAEALDAWDRGTICRAEIITFLALDLSYDLVPTDLVPQDLVDEVGDLRKAIADGQVFCLTK